MNLNPLKKEDNTDALVKALEDANAVGSDSSATQQSTTVTDDAVIASDPQITGDVSVSEPTAQPSSSDSTAPTDTATSEENTATSDSDAATNTASSLTFSGDDLPIGLSSDADAHLPTKGTGENGELDDVKKSALDQLRPLIEKLDLEPADKFDKYLMMLRASDDPALIKPAFDAAQGISGEKEKAQALLDIINEINYITANQQQS